eukprot:TCALIF_07182-PA protein Name:"Similar to WDR20 WD repeat-containing protein 20 (Homo sapiens)" AED:0.04 eAED:0.04 QI:348/0.66/0.5/1/1/1/4/0/733
MMDPLNGLGMAGGANGRGEPAAELKTQFMTREGLYTLLSYPKYAKPSSRLDYSGPATLGRDGLLSAAGSAGASAASGNVGALGAPVRVSFAPAIPARSSSLNSSGASSNGEERSGGCATPNGGAGSGTLTPTTPSQYCGEKITFNFGKEIFVYPYKGLKRAGDLNKPIDKRTYKGTCPTCHDFGPVSPNSDIMPLLIGFSLGQIQLVDPIRKDLSKLYNEERLIEKSRVTCIKWIPGSPHSFLVSYSSGHMYIYNQDLTCPPTVPVYQSFKCGEGYSISTCKTKSSRNPVYRWSVGLGAINEFAFSPCGHFLAVASQDGYLRVFDYDKMELIGIAKSYFGGLLCVDWSPDGKYLVMGGEDDLVTVYSVGEKRVVVRGQGHQSWVSQVAFDAYNLSYGDVPDGLDFSGSDEEDSSLPSQQNGGPMPGVANANPNQHHQHHHIPSTNPVLSPLSDQHVTCYRFGSVGEDTQIGLWDITEDTLKKASLMGSFSAGKTSLLPSQESNAQSASHVHNSLSSSSPPLAHTSGSSSSKDSGLASGDTASVASTGSVSTSTSLSQRLAALNFSDKNKEHKRNFSLTGKSSSDRASNSQTLNGKGATHAMGQAGNSALNGAIPEYVKLGSPQCPRLNEIPLIEPLVMKKIAHERLTALVFREECLVTACQEGLVCTWARPGRVVKQQLFGYDVSGESASATRESRSTSSATYIGAKASGIHWNGESRPQPEQSPASTSALFL